jgi:hypothetical protein
MLVVCLFIIKMVESVLPKNVLNKVSFSNLLQMEEAYDYPLLARKSKNWHKKTSQEHLYKQLCKLFPHEGIKNILAFVTILKKLSLNINILKYKVIKDIS